MFSSIVSLLPSALQINANSHNNVVLDPTDSPAEQQADQLQQEDDISPKKASNASKTRSANETFIFVRPPPAKSNHPLNLQVQLVPPTTRTPQASFDDPDTPVTLTRTTSNRSDTSSYASTVSFSSTTSTSSGRRMIIPLYNLQAHNVMTNTIVDAGTDAKIARFQRRGIELIDLAFLEPVEVWGERPRPAKTSRPVTPDPTPTTAGSSTLSLTSSSHSPQPPPLPLSKMPTTPAISSKRNIFGKFLKKSAKDATPPASPTVSSLSINATPTQHAINPAVTPTLNRSSRTHSRNFSAALSTTNIAGKLGGRDRSSSPNPQVTGLGLTITNDDASTNKSNTSVTDLQNPPSSEEKLLRPPILGIQPTLSYSFVPNTNAPPPPPQPSSNLARNARALMYVWFVRKWLKRRLRPASVSGGEDNDGSSGIMGIVRESARGAGNVIGVGGTLFSADHVEVRFEWRRMGGGKKLKRRGRRSFVTHEGTEDTERERVREKDKERREQSVKRQSNRLSVISHQSFSTTFSASEDGHSPSRREKERDGTPTRGKDKDKRESSPMSQQAGDRDKDLGAFDAGEESDPEDSETPWVCTLKIRKAGAQTSSFSLPRTSTRGQGSLPSSDGARTRTDGSEMGVLTPVPATTPHPQVLKIKVGTLSPTPHHPKVVGMLKVPFPLPDIEVETMEVMQRPIGLLSSRVPASQHSNQLILTAEEIKDVVCSTGLWLAVREGFGGIGKVTRKGDGWRIRA